MKHESQDIIVPIGPQHPALKEPASFLFTLSGEQIKSVNVRVGYNHRGIEKACEQRNYTQDIYLIERVCGICSHSHSTCFVQAVERIAGIEVTRRCQYIRTLVAELERIHSHLLWLGVAGHEIGFDTLLMYTWRDREVVMDILALLTGNRVHYGINKIGGVRRDINPDQIDKIRKAMDVLEERTKYYIGIATEETSILSRLSRVGMLSKEDAFRLGTVGPTARASGIDRDVRRDDPYLAYSDLDFKVITDDHCDVFGRVVVRLLELLETYSMIRQICDKIPDGPIEVKAPRKIPAGETFSMYEAPRGEDVHFVKSDGSDKPYRVKVRAPTLANIQSVAKMLENRYLADAPIIIAAIDPCFSCTDRMIQVKYEDKDTQSVLSWKDLRASSIEWHKKRGFDVSALNRRLSKMMGSR